MNPPGSRTPSGTMFKKRPQTRCSRNTLRFEIHRGSVARGRERLSRKQLVWVRFPAEPPFLRSSFNRGRPSSTWETRVQILSDRSTLSYPNWQRNRVENAASAGSTPARSIRSSRALVEERANSPGSEPGGRKAVWVQIPPGAPPPEGFRA
jgi:hypothetical protein